MQMLFSKSFTFYIEIYENRYYNKSRNKYSEKEGTRREYVKQL